MLDDFLMNGVTGDIYFDKQNYAISSSLHSVYV